MTDELRQGLAQSRQRLLQTLSGVSEAQFKQRPQSNPGETAVWSIAEVLSYLLAADRVSNQNIALALADDGAPAATPDSIDADALARVGRIAPVPQLIHGLLAARRELELLLDKASDLADGGDRSVTGQNGEQRSIVVLADEVLSRERERVGQIESLRERVGANPPPSEA
jgi:hypothetical protein